MDGSTKFLLARMDSGFRDTHEKIDELRKELVELKIWRAKVIATSIVVSGIFSFLTHTAIMLFHQKGS